MAMKTTTIHGSRTSFSALIGRTNKRESVPYVEAQVNSNV